MPRRKLAEGDTVFLVATEYPWHSHKPCIETCTLEVVRANKSSAYAVKADRSNDRAEYRINQSKVEVVRSGNSIDDIFYSYKLYESEAAYDREIAYKVERKKLIQEFSETIKHLNNAELKDLLKELK